MKAVPCSRADVPSSGSRGAQRRPAVRPPGDVEEPLWSEIGRLGGEDRRKGAEGALNVFEASLAQLVRDNPKAYGATGEAASQDRVVADLIGSVRTSFLRQTVETLRYRSGYVRMWGCWIHRAVFTFIGFGLLAAAVLPLCAVSLMSSSAWGWLPGALGLVMAVVLGGWILSRIQHK